MNTEFPFTSELKSVPRRVTLVPALPEVGLNEVMVCAENWVDTANNIIVKMIFIFRNLSSRVDLNFRALSNKAKLG